MSRNRQSEASLWTTGQTAGKIILTFGEFDRLRATAIYMDPPEAAALAEQINSMPLVQEFLKSSRRQVDDDEH